MPHDHRAPEQAELALARALERAHRPEADRQARQHGRQQQEQADHAQLRQRVQVRVVCALRCVDDQVDAAQVDVARRVAGLDVDEVSRADTHDGMVL